MAQRKDRNVLRPRDFRVNSFDPGIDGVDPVTQSGTHVPKGKEDAVMKAAANQGVELAKVEDVGAVDTGSAGNASASGDVATRDANANANVIPGE